MKTLRPSYTAVGNILCNCFVNQFGILQIVDIALTHIPAIPILSIYPRETKACVHTRAHTWIFIAAHLEKQKQGNNPIVHQAGWSHKWIHNMCSIHPYNGKLAYNRMAWSTMITWHNTMNHENLQNERNQTKPYIIWFNLSAMSGICKLIETESRLIFSRGMGPGSLLGVKIR